MKNNDQPPIIGFILSAPMGLLAGVGFALSIYICLAVITLILRAIHIFA